MVDSKKRLIQAIEDDDVEVVQNFLNNQNRASNINKILVKYDQSRALHLAAIARSYNVAKLLIQNGANMNLKNEDGNSCLHVAVRTGDYKLTKLFLEESVTVATNSPNINTQNVYGNTPLHNAMKNCDVAFIELLLIHGADPNISNFSIKRTVLHELLELNENSEDEILQIMKLLVNYGADVNWINAYEMTALCLAVNGELFDVVKYLVNIGCNINITNGKTLLYAIKLKDERIAKFLLENGATIDHNNEEGHFITHKISQAVLSNDQLGYDFFNLFLDKMENINGRDYVGLTLLDLTIQFKHKRLFNLLMERGASICIKDSNDNTPFSAAIRFGVYDFVETLINKGALDYERKLCSDADILNLSLRDKNILKLLCTKGVKVYDENVYRAFRYCHNDTFEFLSSYYIISHSVGPIFHLLAREAIETKQIGKIKYLLDVGADINFKYNNSSSSDHALHFYCQDHDQFKGVAAVILNQMAFMSAQDLHLDEDSLYWVKTSEWLLARYNRCLKEIEMLKVNIHPDHETTYFDLLKKDNYALVKCLRVKKIRRELHLGNYKLFFQEYVDRLERIYNNGVKLLTGMDNFKAALDSIFKHILPNDVTRMISEYYNTNDYALMF